MRMGTVGLGPMTFCMSSRHSNQLSYAPVSVVIIAHLSRDCKGFSEISLFFLTPMQEGHKAASAKGADSWEKAVDFCVFTSFHV